MPDISTILSDSLNKPISDLCPFSIAQDPNQNHCAHYVSHMMGYELEGVTCKNYTWEDKQRDEKGATLRVDDLFEHSPETGQLADKPAFLVECLIFVTLASNMRTVGNQLVMGNQPKKHIGILHNGLVWNYSNSQNKVVSDSLELFKSTFSTAYTTSGTTVEFYYGKFL